MTSIFGWAATRPPRRRFAADGRGAGQPRRFGIRPSRTRDRRAKSESWERYLNDRVYAVLLGFKAAQGEFYCECGDTSCGCLIELTLPEYAAIRANGGRVMMTEAGSDSTPPLWFIQREVRLAPYARRRKTWRRMRYRLRRGARWVVPATLVCTVVLLLR